MALPKTISPDKTYTVTLTKAVEVHPGVWARPGDEVTVTGTVLNSIKDSVSNATEA